jgi:hypothetical protein
MSTRSRKIIFLGSSPRQGKVEKKETAGRIMLKCILDRDENGSRTRNLPACSIVPQPLCNRLRLLHILKKKAKKLHCLSLRANYTDRATAVSWRSSKFCGGCHMVSVTDPYGRILGFLEGSCYFFFQAAPQFYSRG